MNASSSGSIPSLRRLASSTASATYRSSCRFPSGPAGPCPSVDLLGSLDEAYGTGPDASEYPNSLAIDPDHEGHSGWSTAHVLNGHPNPAPGTGSGNIEEWLEDYDYVPHLVLIRLGTVDVHNYLADPAAGELGLAGQVRDNLEGIIEKIHDAAPFAHIWVAKVPPFGPANATGATIQRRTSAVNAVNSMIDDLAEGFRDANNKRNVWSVDQHTGFDPATMLTTDGIHPNAAGEEFIAATFMKTFQWSLDGNVEILVVELGANDGLVSNLSLVMGVDRPDELRRVGEGRIVGIDEPRFGALRHVHAVLVSLRCFLRLKPPRAGHPHMAFTHVADGSRPDQFHHAALVRLVARAALQRLVDRPRGEAEVGSVAVRPPEPGQRVQQGARRQPNAGCTQGCVAAGIGRIAGQHRGQPGGPTRCCYR